MDACRQRRAARSGQIDGDGFVGRRLFVERKRVAIGRLAGDDGRRGVALIDDQSGRARLQRQLDGRQNKLLETRIVQAYDRIGDNEGFISCIGAARRGRPQHDSLGRRQAADKLEDSIGCPGLAAVRRDLERGRALRAPLRRRLSGHDIDVSNLTIEKTRRGAHEVAGRRSLIVDMHDGLCRLLDDCAARAGHDDAQARNEDAIVGQVLARHRIVGHARCALRVRRDHGPGDVPADDEGVAAGTAVESGHHALRRAENVESVVALEAIDRERLNVRIGDIDAAAKYSGRSDDEGVVGLRAKDDERIEPGAALDLDRRVDVIFDRVVAAATLYADVGPGRDEEGSDDKGVIAAAADHREVGLVRIDLEGVLARPAVQHRRLVDAIGQVADGRQSRLHSVSDPRADITRRRSDRRRRILLADLEPVGAIAGVDRHDRRIAVHGEVVPGGRIGGVDIAAVDGQAACNALIVIDPFINPGSVRLDDRRKRFTHEERLSRRCLRAVDRQVVEGTANRAGVVDVDDVVRRRGRIDHEIVAAAGSDDGYRVLILAIVGFVVREARQAWQAVKVDEVLAAARRDECVGVQSARIELDVAFCAAGRNRKSGGGKGAEGANRRGVAVEAGGRGQIAATDRDGRAGGEARRVLASARARDRNIVACVDPDRRSRAQCRA